MLDRNLGQEVPIIEFLVDFFLSVLGLRMRKTLLDILDLKLTVDLAVQDLDLIVLQLIQVLRKGVLRLDSTLAHCCPLCPPAIGVLIVLAQPLFQEVVSRSLLSTAFGTNGEMSPPRAATSFRSVDDRWE